MHGTNRSILCVLEITASQPRLEFGDGPNTSPYIVSRTMRTCGIVRLRTDAASSPFIRGIATSKMTRLGFSSLAFSTASTPSVASPQTCHPAWLSRTARTLSLTLSLSSTIKIVLERESLEEGQCRTDDCSDWVIFTGICTPRLSKTIH